MHVAEVRARRQGQSHLKAVVKLRCSGKQWWKIM